MQVNERMRKILSVLLCVLMLVQYVPAYAFAADTAEDGPCEHHTAHTADCGYVEAVEEQPCTHVHDTAVCGFVEAVQEALCACEATDESGALVHIEGCGYVAPVAGADCTHTHNDTCGYAAAVEAKPCAYVCTECASEPTCTCSAVEGEPHAEDCALYKAPAEVCTCSAAEGEPHAEDCALYEAPAEVCTCSAAEGEPHTEDCALYEAPAEVCTCSAAEGEAHSEDCPLYEVPASPARSATPPENTGHTVCDHIHDDTCGGIANENYCTYPCEACAADLQSLVDTLPAMSDITEENKEAVGQQLTAIDTRKNQTGDATEALVNWKLYSDAAFVLSIPPEYIGVAIVKDYPGSDGGPSASFAFIGAETGEPATLTTTSGVSCETTDPIADGGSGYYYLPAGTYTISEIVDGDWNMTLTVNGVEASDATFTGVAGNGYIMTIANVRPVAPTNFNISNEADESTSTEWGDYDTLISIFSGSQSAETYYPNSDTVVTVIGSREITETLSLHLPNTVTVVWEAQLSHTGAEGSSDSQDALQVSGEGALTISENSAIAGAIAAANGAGIYANENYSGMITVSGGSVSGFQGGILCDGSAVVKLDGATVQGTGGPGIDIQGADGSLSIQNSTVTGNGSQYAVYSEGNVTLSGGVRITNTATTNASTDLKIGENATATIKSASHVVLSSADGTRRSLPVLEDEEEKCQFRHTANGTFSSGFGKDFITSDSQYLVEPYIEYVSNNHFTSRAYVDADFHGPRCPAGCVNMLTLTTDDAKVRHNIEDDNKCADCGVQFYDVWVAGVRVNEKNASDVLGDGTVTFTPSADGSPAVLALNNAIITYETGDGIKIATDVTLSVSGHTTIQASTPLHCDTGATALTIQNTGHLVLNADENSCALVNDANATVNLGEAAAVLYGDGQFAYEVPSAEKLQDQAVYQCIDSDLLGYEPTGQGGSTHKIVCGGCDVFWYFPHGYDADTGKCPDCGAVPVASVKDDYGTSYYYTTLGAALNAVRTCTGVASTTLTLLQSVELTETQTIEGSFFFDLNGCTVSGTADPLLTIESAANVSIVNNSNSSGSITASGSDACGVYLTDGILTINAGNIHGAGYGIVVAGGDLTLNGETNITGGTAGLYLHQEKVICLDENFNPSSPIMIELESPPQDANSSVVFAAIADDEVNETEMANKFQYASSGMIICSINNDTNKTLAVKMCPHAEVDLTTGKCTVCGLQFAASVDGYYIDPLWYEELTDAVAAMNDKNYVDTLTLYKDAEGEITLTRGGRVNGGGYTLNGGITFSGSDSTLLNITVTGETAVTLNGCKLNIDENVDLQGTGADIRLSGQSSVYYNLSSAPTSPYTVVTDPAPALGESIRIGSFSPSADGTFASADVNAVVTWHLVGVDNARFYLSHVVSELNVSLGDVTAMEADSVNSYTAVYNGGEAKIDGTTAEGRSLTDAFAVTWKQLDSTSAMDSAPVNAGVYDFTLAGQKGDGFDYRGVTITGTLTITPKLLDSLSVTLAPSEFIYDGTEHKPAVTIPGLTEGTDFTVAYSNNVNAGNATVTIQPVDNGNYSFDPKTENFHIEKATLTTDCFRVTLPEPSPYNGEAREATVEPLVNGIGGVSVKYFCNGQLVEKPVNAGRYRVLIDVAEGDNYNAVTYLEEQSWNLRITMATPTITCNPTNAVEYNGEDIDLSSLFTILPDDLPVTYSVVPSTGDGSMIGDTNYCVTALGDFIVAVNTGETTNYTSASAGTVLTVLPGQPSYTQPTDLAGTYGQMLKDVTLPAGWAWEEPVSKLLKTGVETFEASFTPENTDLYEIVTDIPLKVTVAPASISGLTVNPIPDQNYTGEPIEPYVLIRDLLRDRDYTVAYSNNTNAGTATVTITGIGNYTGKKTMTFTILPKNINPTINSDITSAHYNGRAIEVNVDLVDGQTEIPADQYTVNYSNNVNVGKAKIHVAPVTGGNYTFTAFDNTFDIIPALLTITAEDKSVPAGGAAPALTYKVTGLCGTDKLITEPTLAYEKAPNMNSTGTTTILVSGADAGPNYTIEYVSGTLTVTTLTQVTVDMSGVRVADKAFDGQPLTYSGTAKGDHDVRFTYAWYDQSGAVVTAPTNAGTYTLRATVNTAGYAGGGEKTVTIEKAKVTITAEDKSASVGSVAPALTYKVTGLCGTDKLITEPTLAYEKAPDMNTPGTTTILVSGAEASANYAIEYVAGKLTVYIPATQVRVDMSTLHVADKAYDGQPLGYSGAATGNYNVQFTYTWYDQTGAVVAAPTDAGIYTLRATVNTNGYTGYGTKTVTIGKATVVITAEDKSAPLGGVTPALTYQVTGLYGTDKLVTVPTLAYEKTPDMNSTGTTTILVSGADAGPNYTIEYVSGTLTVTTLTQVTVDMSGVRVADKAFDGQPLTYSGTAKGDHDVRFTYAWYDQSGAVVTAPTNAGTYTLRATVNTAGYAGGGEKTVTIDKAKVTITAEDKSASVGSVAPALTYKVTGLCGTDKLVTVPTLAYEKAPDMNTPGTTTILVSGADAGPNYAIEYVAGKLTVYIPATQVRVDMSDVTVADKAFDGKPLTYSGTAVGNHNVRFTYTWYDQSGAVVTAPTDAGTYTLRATVDTNGYTGYGTKTVTIEKATVTITANDLTAEVGAEMPELTYTVTGLIKGDSLKTEPTLTCDADMTTAGEYEITLTGAVVPNTKNYQAEIIYKTGTLTVTAPAAEEEEAETTAETTAEEAETMAPVTSTDPADDDSSAAETGADIEVDNSSSPSFPWWILLVLLVLVVAIVGRIWYRKRKNNA